MRARRRPPKRQCRECGTDIYAWAEGSLCATCVKATTAMGPTESLRAFRRRVIEGRGK